MAGLSKGWAEQAGLDAAAAERNEWQSKLPKRKVFRDTSSKARFAEQRARGGLKGHRDAAIARKIAEAIPLDDE